MRVLMISTCPIEKNGITNVIFNIIKNVACDKLYFDIVSINEPGQYYRDELRKICNGKIYFLNRDYKCIIKYVRNLVELIKTNQYDIVHIHGNSATVAFETIAATLAGCKVKIVHSHNTTCTSKIVDKCMRPLFYATYSHGLACGEAAGKWLFGEKRYTVLNNGIDTNRFRFNEKLREETRKEYNILEDTIVIGHVGVFNEQKNHSFLLDIFYKLYQKDSNYKLMLIGEGRLKDYIRDLVKKYELNDSVIFIGGVQNVEKYLSACDLIVMPSLYEGLPLSLIEEQANGLSCVVSDSITEEVDKTGNVYFVSLNESLEQWVKSIQEVDVQKERSKKSENAIRKIERCGYSIQTETQKLITYYADALQER